jgi:hypothetical protein
VEPFLTAWPSFGQPKPESEPRGFELKGAILQACLILSAPRQTRRARSIAGRSVLSNRVATRVRAGASLYLTPFALHGEGSRQIRRKSGPSVNAAAVSQASSP